MPSDLEALRAWHDEYLSADGSQLSLNSEIVTSVNADHLDSETIEQLVQNAIPRADVSDGFCKKVRLLFEQWPDIGNKSWTYAAGTTFGIHEIAAAARSGCQFCAFLMTRMKVEQSLNTFLQLDRRLRILEESAEMILSIQNWTNDQAQLIWLNLPGKESKHCNSPGSYALKFETHVVPASTKPSSENQQPFDIARDWLQACTASHESCGTKATLDRPSRLVLIQDDSIRLVQCGKWKAIPKYATLSYCWGKGDFTKLTLENTEILQQGIPRETLPATFKDAILIAEELGVDHIWIDALCIIQNDVDDIDWKHESGLMRSVYGGSFINIAASSALDAHGGCFLKPEHHNCGFSAYVNIGGETQRKQSFHVAEVHQESTDSTHLATRAWAYQERLLAARTLHVGEHGFFWECRNGIASEFLTEGFPGKLGLETVIAEGQEWSWDDILRQYTKASLTNEMDKLPALSGIARRQHEATGGLYLAGLWRENLVPQLAWQPEPEGRCTRPRLRAPSWSWASVDGPLWRVSWWTWNNDNYMEYVKILDATTQPSGDDPFGRVNGGEITLATSVLIRGKFCDFPVGKRQDLQGVEIEPGGKQFPILLDCIEDGMSEGDVVYLLPLLRGPTGSGFGLAKKAKAGDDGDGSDTSDGSDSHNEKNSEEDNENSGNAKTKSSDDEDEEESTANDGMSYEQGVFGLVIQRHGSLKGYFRRVGSFEYLHCDVEHPHPRRDYSHYHPFLQVLDEVGTSEIQEECPAVTSDSAQSGKEFVIVLE